MNALALKDAEISAENFIRLDAERIRAPAATTPASAWSLPPSHGKATSTAPTSRRSRRAHQPDKGGIVGGDIITKIAGKSLTEKDPKDDSSPGVRLISVIGTLAVGKPVDLELRRGTATKNIKVTPNDEPSGAIARMTPSPVELSRLPVDRLNQVMTFGGDMPSRAAMPVAPQFNLFNGSGNFAYAFGNNGLFASYELAPRNEKLGAYFGTTEGVLVVNNHVFEDRATAPGAPRDAVRGKIQYDTAYATNAPRAGIAARTGGNMVCDSAIRAGSTTINCRGRTELSLERCAGPGWRRWVLGSPGRTGQHRSRAGRRDRLGRRPQGDQSLAADEDRRQLRPQ